MQKCEVKEEGEKMTKRSSMSEEGELRWRCRGPSTLQKRFRLNRRGRGVRKHSSMPAGGGGEGELCAGDAEGQALCNNVRFNRRGRGVRKRSSVPADGGGEGGVRC